MLSVKTLIFVSMIILLLCSLPIASPTPASINVNIQTDKNKYLGDELVYIIGEVISNGSPLVGVYVGLEVDKPDGSPIFVDQLVTNSCGMFETSFKLPSDAPEGAYKVTATYGYAQGSTEFNVTYRTHLPDVYIAWARGICYKEVILPNIISYHKSYYIFHWIDESGDGIPQSSEIFEEASG